MRTAGIYLILHVRTGKVYVGQSTSFALRWKKHKEDLILGQHHNHRLQTLWSQEGSGAFEFRTLHFLPDNLSPLERQRWLVRREEEVWEDYRKRDLALNIIRPEIVETPAALAEYKIERRTATTEITSQIKELKPQVKEANLTARRKSQESYMAQQEKERIEALLKRNTGWRSFLFGKTTNVAVDKIKSELEAKQVALQTADAEKERAIAEAQALAEQSKDLYRSYPGNADRRLRRLSMFSGSRRRKTTIR